MSVVNALAAALAGPRVVGYRGRQVAVLAVVLLVALAIAFLPPLAAFWLIFGGALVALVIVVPVAGVYLLPLAVGFGSVTALTVRGINVGPTDLLVGALVLAWLMRMAGQAWNGEVDWPGAIRPQALWMHLRAATRRDPMRVALYSTVLAYLAVVTLSLVVAADHAATLKEIVKWGEVAALIPLAFALLPDLRHVRLLAWSIIAAGTLQAITGLWQWATLGAEAASGRIWGTFDQPNPFAGYLNVALILAVVLLFFSPDRRERWMMGAATVLLVAAEVVARSRGALLGLAAAAVVIVVVGWRAERLFAWVAGIGLPAVALAWVTHLIPLSLQQRLLDQVRLDPVAVCTEVNNANFSIMARLAYWQAALRMFAAHPLLGVGAGNYNAAYAPYAIWCWPDPLGHAHNYYLNAAAETGILGLVAFLAMTGMSFVVGYLASHRTVAFSAPSDAATQAIPRSLSPSSRVGLAVRAVVAPLIAEGSVRRALALGVFAVLIAVAVQNLTDDLFVHAMELQFALCFAVLLRLRVPSHSEA